MSNTIPAHLTDLRHQIDYHNYRYNVLDDPIISDAEFDKLMLDLRAIEAENPEWITPDSPTQRVAGAPMDRFEKIRHPGAILSLANAFDDEGVLSWYDRIQKLDPAVALSQFVVEPKIDGLTVVLHYEDGVFIQGATRGDGIEGEDITSNLRTIRTLPLRIPAQPEGPAAPHHLVVRGEAFINTRDFNALNQRLLENGEKTYLNPRNTAAGSLRQLDPKLTASRPLTMLIYQIVETDGLVPTTQWGLLQYLKDLGFPVTVHATLCDTIQDALIVCHNGIEQRDQLPYEADGQVIKLNDLVTAANLGIVGKDPRGAIAYKFPAREVTTSLLEIRTAVGRTGVLTPYAVLEPVDIGGVVVKQATLHNFDYITEKDIRVGDRVMVKRAGDVIPYVIGPIVDLRNGQEIVYQPPSICPTCGEPVEHLAGEVAWYCVNSACPAQLVRNLEHFVSREAMDIVGMGIKIVEQLVEAGMLKDLGDIYYLSKDKLTQLEGFGMKRAFNLLESIDYSRSQPLARLITALGIHGIGEVSAADLARHYHDLDKLAAASFEELQQIEGIGPNTAQSVVDWFSRKENLDLIKKLKRAGVQTSEPDEASNPSLVQSLEGSTFVITGTLPTLGRDEAKEFIQQRGGKVTDTVSTKTNYLVLGENPGSKLDKARQLNIPILDEAALKKLAGE